MRTDSLKLEYGHGQNPLSDARLRAELARLMDCGEDELSDFQVLKKGMTNHSYIFRCRNDRYILRVPGEGTDRMIDRAGEAAVYQALHGLDICDDVAHIDPESGLKISRYYPNARVCDPLDRADVEACMERLRRFHALRLSVPRVFDIFGQIGFYESLWEGKPSVYPDYGEIKRKVFSLRSFIDRQQKEYILSHIDAVPDNFLFVGGGDIRLIDWEYAGMQDPHVDIAMFGIYALYGREQMEALIDCYFAGKCPPDVRAKVYCYIAACGLLWSNWCEYKKQLGVDFGDYAKQQYRYAGEYYETASEAIARLQTR